MCLTSGYLYHAAEGTLCAIVSRISYGELHMSGSGKSWFI